MRESLSVIIPVCNEAENIQPLYLELESCLNSLAKSKEISSYELIFVDDGSRDNTLSQLKNICSKKKNCKVISFRRNFGQTAALKAGFEASNGDLIVTMDGDLQNDPQDIKNLIEKLREGYDAVSGWRYKRKDPLGKKISSRIMNNLRHILIGDFLHDYGCSLKIYKRDCLADLELFGELHRYITAYLYIKGYKIGETKVNHRPRKHGRTKYGFKRGTNGVLDLFFLKYWASFSHKPLHFFGRLGIYQWGLSILIVIEQIIKAIILGRLNFGPLLALASMLVITGLITIIFGFMSEMLARVYFKDKKIYSIREEI